MVNVRQILRDAVSPDSIGRNSMGNLILRWGYYWRPKEDATISRKLRIATALEQAGIQFEFRREGYHVSALSSGAPIARQSHLWIEIKTYPPVVVPDDHHDAAEN